MRRLRNRSYVRAVARVGVNMELVVINGGLHGLVGPKSPPACVPGAAEVNERCLQFAMRGLL